MEGLELKKVEKIKSPGGSLSFFESGKEFDYDIKRIYYIYEFNESNRRGFHAHKQLKQVMFCPYGKIEVEINDGRNKKSIILDDPTKILVLNKGYWREFVSLKEGSILCVGASDTYDENDYIRDYNEYLEWLGEENEDTV